MEMYCEKIQTFCVLFVGTILTFFLTERHTKLKNRFVSLVKLLKIHQLWLD